MSDTTRDKFIKNWCENSGWAYAQMSRELDSLIDTELRSRLSSLEEENGKLREALETARTTIKQWHDVREGALTQSGRAFVWELYQQSPEMQKINAALSNQPDTE